MAASLYSKGLVSSDTRDRVIDTRGMETAEKAAILLAEVERVIRTCSGLDRRMLFDELCSVIKDHPVARSQLRSM